MSPSSPRILPPYLVDKGLDAKWGGWVIALIGLFNIIGSITAGVLGEQAAQALPPLDDLCLRAVVISAFLLVPLTPRAR